MKEIQREEQIMITESENEEVARKSNTSHKKYSPEGWSRAISYRQQAGDPESVAMMAEDVGSHRVYGAGDTLSPLER